MPAVSPPVRMPLASSTVIFFTAPTSSVLASGTAASAARFMVSTSSSAYLPMPRRRIHPSALCKDSGSGIFTRALPKKPSVRPRDETAARDPFSSAVLSAATACLLLIRSSCAAAGWLQASAAINARNAAFIRPRRPQAES